MIAFNCNVPKMRALPSTDPRYSSASDDEYVYDDYSGNFSGEENSPLPTNMVILFICICITYSTCIHSDSGEKPSRFAIDHN